MNAPDMSEYRLDDLGWYQFERLVQSLLKARHGFATDAWGGYGDHGRDAYAEGPLRFPDPHVPEEGPFVFQAKFIERANARGSDFMMPLKKAVRAELKQIAERRKKGVWDEPTCYVLITNAPISAGDRADVKRLVTEGLPGSRIVVQGAKDVDDLLNSTPQIRLSFPQVLGLRDLRALLEDTVARDVIQRSSVLVDIAQEMAEVFVPTRAYRRSLETLGVHQFVVLTGPPEMGKTTIAYTIAAAKLSHEWDAYDCRDPDEFFKVYADERPQVFIGDDAFGSTEYLPEMATRWARDLHKILRKLDARHWMIFTSRPAPLKRALESAPFQDRAASFPDPAEVIVDASNLSVEEKAHILYRHARAASLDEEPKEIIKRNARKIVQHPHFTPLRIKRFVRDDLPVILNSPEIERGDLVSAAIQRGLEEPTPELERSFNSLDEHQRWLLIAMLDTQDQRISLDDLEESFRRVMGGTAPVKADEMVESIRGHFLEVKSGSGYLDP